MTDGQAENGQSDQEYFHNARKKTEPPTRGLVLVMIL
jgi:hypothetical protein